MGEYQRCPWAKANPLEKAYHDSEWGTPLFDDQRLFEFLILEGAQAGLSWKTILYKRDGYRKAFDQFDPEKVARYNDSKIAQLQQDAAIIRNRQKVLGVQVNAQYIVDTIKEHGCFGKFVGRWPNEDLIGLFSHLKKHGSRLGGMTGQRVLRNMGKDTFIVTSDVVRALQRSGLDIKDSPSSAREMRLIQAAFNQWHKETGRPYTHLSRILAMSVG